MEDPAATLGMRGREFLLIVIFSNVFDPDVDLQLCWVSRRSSIHLQHHRVLVLAGTVGI